MTTLTKVKSTQSLICPTLAEEEPTMSGDKLRKVVGIDLKGLWALSMICRHGMSTSSTLRMRRGRRTTDKSSAVSY